MNLFKDFGLHRILLEKTNGFMVDDVEDESCTGQDLVTEAGLPGEGISFLSVCLSAIDS